MTPHAAEWAGDGWKVFDPNDKSLRLKVDSDYLVQIDDDSMLVIGGRSLHNWESYNVVAFRELPPKYEPPKPKCCKWCGNEGGDVLPENQSTKTVWYCGNHLRCRDRLAAQLASATARNEAVERVVEAAKKWREEYRYLVGTDSAKAVCAAVDALAASQAKGG